MTAVAPSDGAVIAASMTDAAAFAAVFDRHWERISRFCASRAGSAGEDLAAETFRVAFDQRGRFDPHRGDAGPWLFGIATNLLRNFFRSTVRGQQAIARLDSGLQADSAEDSLQRIEAEQLGPDLAVALAALSAAERDTLLLYAWGELTYEEIAISLDIPIGTVRSRIHRARTGMRAHLSTASKDRS